MKIEQVDKNFVLKTDVTEPDLVWLRICQEPFSIHGLVYDEAAKGFVRIPQAVAKTVSSGVQQVSTWTSGGRVRFKTNSSFIAIQAKLDPSWHLAQMTNAGMSGFDLYRNFKGKETYFTTFLPPKTWDEGYSAYTKTFGELTDYTLYFPLYHSVQEVYIGLKKGSILEKAEPYLHQTPVLFYGNSITQGGCASRPANTYPSMLSRRLNTDFINLGFSGNGKGEKEMAEYIAKQPMSVFVMDYDSNAPTPKWLADTHYPFYKTIREKNPTLPIIMISHPSALHGVFYKLGEYDVWGTFALRRKIVKSTYEQAKAEGDENVYFIDGRELFKGDQWDDVTTDGTHPNDFGFMRIAQYLEKVLSPLLVQ